MRTILMGLAVLTLLTACGAPLYKPGNAPKEVPQISGDLSGTEGYITVNERIELFWFAQGSGEPVLMIHGGPGYPFKEAWKGLEPLSQGRRFIYYHQRGSGRSTRPVDRFASKNYHENMMALESALGLTTQLRDIEAFRIALKAESLTLIGHSYGGFLASLYAAEYPDRVKSLILIAPAEVVRMPMKHSGGLYDSVRARLPKDKEKEFDAFMKRFFDYGKIFQKSEQELKELNNEFIRYYALAYESGVPEENLYEMDDIAGWGQHALFFSTGQRYDLSPQMGKIRAKTLILTGTQDLASEAEILDTYGKIPAVTHLRLEAGHFPFEENSGDFSRIVAGFLGWGL